MIPILVYNIDQKSEYWAKRSVWKTVFIMIKICLPIAFYGSVGKFFATQIFRFFSTFCIFACFDDEKCRHYAGVTWKYTMVNACLPLDSFPLSQSVILFRAPMSVVFLLHLALDFLLPSRTSHRPRSRICRIERFRLTDFTGIQNSNRWSNPFYRARGFRERLRSRQRKPSIRSAPLDPRGILGALRNFSVPHVKFEESQIIWI